MLVDLHGRGAIVVRLARDSHLVWHLVSGVQRCAFLLELLELAGTNWPAPARTWCIRMHARPRILQYIKYVCVSCAPATQVQPRSRL